MVSVGEIGENFLLTKSPASYTVHVVNTIYGGGTQYVHCYYGYSVFVYPGLYMDSQAGLDFLLSRRDIDRKKIIVFGRSLGGAVAIYLAASHANRDK